MKYLLLISAVVLMSLTTSAQDSDTAETPKGVGPGASAGAGMSLGSIALVWCPPGKFMMGSPDSAEDLARKFGGAPEWYSDELPQREVEIATGFWISAREISREEWQEVMRTAPWGDGNAAAEGAPAANVTWEEAGLFAREFGALHGCVARLPQEAEWEYASRAGTVDQFYFGADATALPLNAQCRANANGNPQPGGMLPPNAWGLHDSLGNVWEWCQDKYTLPGSPRSVSGVAGFRIIRGGAAHSAAAHLRCSYRTALPITTRSPRIGVRIVVEP